MNIQDLVLENLQAEEAQAPLKTLIEMRDEHLHEFDVLSLGRAAESFLQEGPSDPDEVRRQVAPVATHYLRAPASRSYYHRTAMHENPGATLLLMLLDWLESQDADDLQEMYLFLRKTNNRLEQHNILASDNSKIAFLQDIWGEETAEVISDFTKVSLPTVKGWLRGSSPSSTNSSLLGHMVTIIYQLYMECGVPREDVPAWIREDRFNGRSVFQVCQEASYRYSLPEEVREHLRSMGADL